MDPTALYRILPLRIFGWLVLICSLVSTAPTLSNHTGTDIGSLFQAAANQQGTSMSELLRALNAYLKGLPNFNKTSPPLPHGHNETGNETDMHPEGEEGEEGEHGAEGAHEGEKHHGVEVVAWNFEEVATPLIISIFMLFTGIFKLIFHHLEWLSSKVPESCLLILFGTGMGAILHYGMELDNLKLDPNMFMMYLLPPIVLDAAYSLHDRVFFNNVGTILLYAALGTVVNFLLMGPTLYGLSLVGAMGPGFKITLLQCLIFASFIVAVDPVAVLAIFQEIGVNNELYFLVFGESLLNDAVTIVLYDMMLAFGGMDEIPPTQIGVGVASFFTVSLGGALVGTLFGILTCLLTRCTYHVRVVEPLAMIVLAYMSYLCGDLFHWSGLISMICCGLVQAQYAFHNVSRKSLTTVKYFMKMLSSTSDAIIFLFLGLELIRTSHEWVTGFALWSLALCLIFRLVSVFGLTFLVNRFVRAIPVSLQEQFIMWYGGLRGAVCFALCATLPENFEYRSMFLTTTLLVIFFTVFLQGMTVKPFVSCCNISRKRDEDLYIAEEFNQLVTDHVMAGVEAVVGQFMGDNYIRQSVVRLNDKYLRKILMRNPMTQEEQILQVYHEIALKDHVYHIKQSTSKPVPNLPDVDSEKADLKENYILEQEPKQENGMMPNVFTPHDVPHKLRKPSRRRSSLAAMLMGRQQDAQSLNQEDTIFGLQLAIARSFAHGFHQKHDRNLTHDDDTDYLAQLQEKHKRIRETRRRQRPMSDPHGNPESPYASLERPPVRRATMANPEQFRTRTPSVSSAETVPDVTVLPRQERSVSISGHFPTRRENSHHSNNSHHNAHINPAFNPITEEEGFDDDDEVPITKL